MCTVIGQVQVTQSLLQLRVELTSPRAPGPRVWAGIPEHSFYRVYNFMHSFLAVLGLRCCAGFLTLWDCSRVVVCGLLAAAASLTAERRLQGPGSSLAGAHGLSRCGHRLQSTDSLVVAQHMRWALPRSGIEPVSPALAGGSLPPSL